MRLGRHAHFHLHRKHLRAGVRRGIGVGAQLFDIDAETRKKLGQIMHDAGMIQRHHFDVIRQHRLSQLTRAGALDHDAQTELHAQRFELGFQFGQCIPGPGHQHQDGELPAQHHHPALFDIAAGFGDLAGETLHQADLVLAGGGDDEIIVC